MSTPQELRIVRRLLKQARRKETIKLGLLQKAKDGGAKISTIFFFKGEASAYTEMVEYLQRVELDIMDGIANKEAVVTHVVEETEDDQS